MVSGRWKSKRTPDLKIVHTEKSLEFCKEIDQAVNRGLDFNLQTVSGMESGRSQSKLSDGASWSTYAIRTRTRIVDADWPISLFRYLGIHIEHFRPHRGYRSLMCSSLAPMLLAIVSNRCGS